MSTLTGAVIARDEEQSIRECLASLAWADRLLVVIDDRSQDATESIAREYAADVQVSRFVSFPKQRNLALDLVTTDWVFFVDADELVGEELSRETRDVIGRVGPDTPVGYWVPRHNIIWGTQIRYGGWYPDYQLRLLRAGNARYDEQQEVHEVVVLDGTGGHLHHPLIHHNYRTVGEFLRKQDNYTTLDARTLRRRGIRPRPHSFVLQPLREFHRRYVKLGGYRDGHRGLLLATLLAYYTFVTYAKLWRLG